MIQFKWPKSLLIMASALILLLVAGCAGDGQSTDSSAKSSNQAQSSGDVSSDAAKIAEGSSAKAVQQKTITIYFPDANGEKLVAVQRQIPAEGPDMYAAAVQAVIDGPMSDAEGIAIVPKGTKLLGIDVKDGIATVDFSREFQADFKGGSTGEFMLIGSIVDTLTQFDDIKSVRISVEGETIDSLAGHLDLSVPQQRMNDLLKN